MSSRIFLSAPDVGQVEQEAVLAAMQSGWIAPLGPDVDAFEAEMAARVGVAHGVALSSGTAALHLGLLALGVGVGDLVLTSTMTFAATANAITYTGAQPVFVDSDPTTGNIDVVLLEEALANLAAAGTPARAIVPVDLLGKAVDYTVIEELAARHEVPVLADAAESLGATHRGRAAGSFGAASIVSFNGNKIMTTSGGGMLLTDDRAIADRVRYLSTQARQPVVHYEHTEVGFNYRLSNLLAALGRAQLRRLDDMISRRRDHRERYRALFAQVPGVTLLGGHEDVEDNCWLTAVLIDPDIAGFSAADLRHALDGDNIESRPLWKPMHRQPAFDGTRRFITGASDQLFRIGVVLPSGSVLDDSETNRVVAQIEEFTGSQR
ncbi:DegT/DnrJ/EryC1/StrS family aminotransferase [Pseudactinotalea suaedae]|uniref:DegT/DnrJ/EryC1/StrS family aminotransferase n=1 Tax=Pseudactinotalea suaedae TaxID=1524924 RepID=UPI0012E30084|nr:aminotransferase class I/II-fold pyridoxal phosphate-dependent enzyme [Pseudactinotalea suaedae]